MHRELLMLRIEVVILRDSGQLFADLKFSGQGREGYKSLVGEADLPVVSASASIHRYRQHWTIPPSSRERYFPRDFGALEAAGIVIQRPDVGYLLYAGSRPVQFFVWRRTLDS